MPVNHQLQEVGFLFSHILLPLFCKWIRIWLVSLFTVYLSRAISKHLISNIGQSVIHTRPRIPSLVTRARPLPFPPTRTFSHTCKIPSSFQSQTQSKTLPPLKAKLLIPSLTCMEFLQSSSSSCCTSRSFQEKKPLTQRKCKADGFSTNVQGGRRERMKF